jgi:hypothetical protein
MLYGIEAFRVTIEVNVSNGEGYQITDSAKQKIFSIMR